jgi:hypothetical protein
VRSIICGAAALALLAACAPAPLTPTPFASVTPFALPTAARPTPTALPTFTPEATGAALLAPTATPAPAAGLAEFERAKALAAGRYQFALRQGAQFLATPDGRSFYVLWYPPGAGPANPPPIVVTLPAAGAGAFDEFFLWQPYAAERGYGLIALQWKFEGGSYAPAEAYHNLTGLLAQQNVGTGNVLLHGYGEGAALTYGLTALDRESGNFYFRLALANAGGAAEDAPLNVEISNGAFGPQPFAGSHWVLYCGRADPRPERDGCPAMQRARNWIVRFGGTVTDFIADAGGHGGFQQKAGNVNTALDAFAGLLGP